jgi:hypothetical protein
MAITSKTTLKTYFETGDKPTQAEFVNLIDSLGLVCVLHTTCGHQSISVLTSTTVQFRFADIDIFSAWDASNYKYDVPSSLDGYDFFTVLRIRVNKPDNNTYLECKSRVNSVDVAKGRVTSNFSSNTAFTIMHPLAYVGNLSTSDYIDFRLTTGDMDPTNRQILGGNLLTSASIYIKG